MAIIDEIKPSPTTQPVIISKANNIILGENCDISFSHISDEYTYKIKFSLGSWEEKTDYITPTNTGEYNYTGYGIPIESVSKELPNSTVGTMTAYLYTYYNGELLGNATSKTFLVTIPESVKPKITGLSAEIINDNTKIDEWNVCVSGYSKIKINITAEGCYGSRITGFKVSGNYSVTTPGSEILLNDSIIPKDNKVLTITAIDSRGRNSIAGVMNFTPPLPYSKPNILSFSASRSKTDSKKIIVKANWEYTSLNDNNRVQGILYFKERGKDNWQRYGHININEEREISEFSENSSYDFKLEVTDLLGEKAIAKTFVPRSNVLIDLKPGGKGLGIGKYAEEEKLEIALDSIFYGDVYLNIDNEKVLLKDYIKKVIDGKY